MLEEFVGRKIVVDLSSPYVCLGKLQRVGEHFIELRHCDIHDLRDTQTSRENYVAQALASGIKRNRKRALVRRAEIVAVAALDDVTAD